MQSFCCCFFWWFSVGVLRCHYSFQVGEGSGPVPVWTALAASVKALTMEKKTEEAEMDEVPSDFLCELMCTTMTDPVVLEPGKQVVDRSSIEGCLRSGVARLNPYTRQPMREEDIVALPELKERIEAWFLDQKNKAKVEKK
jgi:hypothetical protein